MKETLNNKIFRLLTGLVLITTLVLLIVIWNSTSKSITQNLTNRLELAESVIVRELKNRQQELIQDSLILMDDFRLKQAINKLDIHDTQKILASHREIVDAAFITVASANEEFVVAEGHLSEFLPLSQNKHAKQIAIKEGQFSTLVMLNKRLVWVLWLPIKDNAGNISAYASLGIEIGKSYLMTLRDLIALDITVSVNTKSSFIVSSLPKAKQNIDYLEESLLDNDKSPWMFLNPITNKNSLFSHKFEQTSIGNISNTIYLSANGAESQSSFLNLQFTIGAIALVALLIAIIAGRLFARQITLPLEYIANYAESISKGDYSKDIKLNNICSVEFERLLNAFKSMQQGVKRRESEIIYQAQHDMLTSLYNRNYFTDHLDSLFTQNMCFQAIGIKIKGFRSINDVFGYQYGDICLQELAARISQLGGMSARLSGGEILWIPETQLSVGEIEDIKHGLETDIHTHKISIPMKSCIGILNCPVDAQNSEDLYRRMNIAIDLAPMNKRLLVEFNNSLEENYLRRLSIIEKLKIALSSKSQDLSLAYQPKLNLKTQQVEMVEALIRWTDQDLGFVPPDEFIIIAEHAGFIDQVTKWVLERAIQDILSFRQQDVNVCVAINISAQDLLNEDFLDYTLSLLNKSGLDHNAIAFELTETIIVQEPEKSISSMQALRDAGFSVSIDDFGTGYSSLSYITQLPVDTIKIDKCFVMPLASQQGEQSICKAVLSMAKNFNMLVVAEGVEDKESMDLLTDWGCTFAQGYYISRPVAPIDLVAWIHHHRKNNTRTLNEV